MTRAISCSTWLSTTTEAVPELPEVETIRRGIAPYLVGQRIHDIIVREPRLRFPVAPELSATMRGQRIGSVDRRSKYLLLRGERNTLMLHLGMSGRLHVLPEPVALRKHDHVDIALESGTLLRLHDPRRFGYMVLQAGDAAEDRWLMHLGPEPLGAAFTADYLHGRFRGRTAAVKAAIMDAGIVVGVGNIYAQEALFRAGIRPARAAGRVSRADCARLVNAIKEVLEQAIAAGGTTLRDFSGADGAPGYFQQDLFVYGREGQACRVCSATLRMTRITGRSSGWCPSCQPR